MALRENNITVRKVAIALPGKDVLIRYFQMPKIPRTEWETAIKFEAKPPVKKKAEENILTSWKDIKKILGTFNLEAKKGEIDKKIVTGVLGENGIGKTSFVKILANEIKPDKGKILQKVKVSYKPQYLESGSEELVLNVLKDAIKKYTNEIINPLNIKPLYNKKLNELSGGELQRVSIALCLSKDADLYLLDEPSAYLDVEQRLIISKIIKDLMDVKGKTALIVDHDLLFVDYLSNRLIVFSGTAAKEGFVNGPFIMEDGMNFFLGDIDLTFRRDTQSSRPRANKQGSQMDREQKAKNKLYYV